VVGGFDTTVFVERIAIAVTYLFVSVTENKKICCSEAVEVLVIEIRNWKLDEA
jgi:hypothetical protein